MLKIASFQKALQLGVDAIELDVYALEDGSFGTGYVVRKTLPELKQLDAGNGEKISTFSPYICQLRNYLVMSGGQGGFGCRRRSGDRDTFF